MAAPLITAITTVPNRENATNQASFSNDVDTFFSEVNGFQTEANAQAQYLDGVAAQVDADAATALSAKNSAVAAANYRGDWTVSSDVKQGESYTHLGKEWIAKQDSVGVTPVDGAFWIEGFGDAVNVRYDNTVSGLAATEVQSAIDEVYAYNTGTKIIATGSVSFDGSNNAITATGIGQNLLIGDVVTLENVDVNNGEYTVEFVSIDAIRVNEAHAGRGTTKSLTTGAYGAMVAKLLCRSFIAGNGVGQEWLDVTASRLGSDTQFRNLTGKSIEVAIVHDASLSSEGAVQVSMDAVTWTNVGGSSGTQPNYTSNFTVPKNAYYRLRAATFLKWSELR